jgi:PrcB C-terminal
MIASGKYLSRGSVFFAMSCLAACGSVPLPVSDVFTSTHCNIAEESLVAIRDAKMLNDVIQKSQSSFLNAKSLAVPKVNFDSSVAYVISMGNRPTAGYSIQLNAKEAPYEEGVVKLPITFIAPGKMNVAQVITSPCKIVVLPKGDYKRVEM